MSGQRSNDDILLFIMRHGEAEALKADDRSRQLTATGREQVSTAARWLEEHYCPSHKVDMALVSPYRRTRQTYDVLSVVLPSQKTEICDDVIPDGNAQWVHDFIDAKLESAQGKNKPIKSLIVVSHMPLVSYLVDSLCQSYTTSLFSTASIAVIRYSLAENKGQLVEHFQSF